MKSRQQVRRASSGFSVVALAGVTSAAFAVACSGAPTPTIDDVDEVGGGNAATQTTTTTSPTPTTSSSSAAPAGTNPGGSDAGGSGSGPGDASAGADATALDGGGGTGARDAGKEAGPEASAPPTGHHPPTVPPTRTCSYSPNGDGFFTMTEAQGTYVVRLPTGYVNTKAYPVVIGTHGCSDSADNFCTWGPAAYNDDASERENDKLSYIAIAVEDVSGACWSLGDSGKVLAALDDAISCFYVDQAHVTMAGYSSGAAVAYKVGLGNASRFAGILIEDGALYDNGPSAEASLLANASWKINIAHLTHDGDGDYPKAQVMADWTVIRAAGFPLDTTITGAPSHDGSSMDWYSWLEPHTTAAAWTAP